MVQTCKNLPRYEYLDQENRLSITPMWHHLNTYHVPIIKWCFILNCCLSQWLPILN
jgi:hypothetical protein